jgi:hypothetical protein
MWHLSEIGPDTYPGTEVLMAKQVKRKPGKRTASKGPAKKGARTRASATAQSFSCITDALTAPVVREAIAEALVAGATAAAAVFAKQHGPSARKVKAAASGASSATSDLADAAMGALAGSATETIRGMLPAAAPRGTLLDNGVGKRRIEAPDKPPPQVWDNLMNF